MKRFLRAVWKLYIDWAYCLCPVCGQHKSGAFQEGSICVLYSCACEPEPTAPNSTPPEAEPVVYVVFSADGRSYMHNAKLLADRLNARKPSAVDSDYHQMPFQGLG